MQFLNRGSTLYSSISCSVNHLKMMGAIDLPPPILSLLFFLSLPFQKLFLNDESSSKLDKNFRNIIFFSFHQLSWQATLSFCFRGRYGIQWKIKFIFWIPIFFFFKSDNWKKKKRTAMYNVGDIEGCLQIIRNGDLKQLHKYQVWHWWGWSL